MGDVVSSTSNRRGRARRVVAVTIVGALGLAACGDDDDADEVRHRDGGDHVRIASGCRRHDGGDGGSRQPGEEVAGGEEVEITFLTNNDPNNVTTAEAVIAAFESAHPNVSVQLDTRPGGSEGDNLVKTRLATGDMADVFEYNSGSLFQAIAPDDQPPADHRSAVRRRSRPVVRRRRVGRR